MRNRLGFAKCAFLGVDQTTPNGHCSADLGAAECAFVLADVDGYVAETSSDFLLIEQIQNKS